jgi:hypothetical protein
MDTTAPPSEPQPPRRIEMTALIGLTARQPSSGITLQIRAANVLKGGVSEMANPKISMKNIPLPNNNTDSGSFSAA